MHCNHNHYQHRHLVHRHLQVVTLLPPKVVHHTAERKVWGFYLHLLPDHLENETVLAEIIPSLENEGDFVQPLPHPQSSVRVFKNYFLWFLLRFHERTLVKLDLRQTVRDHLKTHPYIFAHDARVLWRYEAFLANSPNGEVSLDARHKHLQLLSIMRFRNNHLLPLLE